MRRGSLGAILIYMTLHRRAHATIRAAITHCPTPVMIAIIASENHLSESSDPAFVPGHEVSGDNQKRLISKPPRLIIDKSETRSCPRVRSRSPNGRRAKPKTARRAAAPKKIADPAIGQATAAAYF